jgi:hypothetical protein
MNNEGDSRLEHFERLLRDKAVHANTEAMLRGELNASCENDTEGFQDSVSTIMREFPDLFFREMQKLERFDQDLLLSYLLLHKTQVQLSRLYKMTQLAVSKNIRESLGLLGANLLFKDYAESDIRSTLERCKVPDAERNAAMVKFFLDTKSVAATRDKFQILVRHRLARIADALKESADLWGTALGAALSHTLSYSYGGIWQRRYFDVFCVDSQSLGQATIDIENCEGIFASRADGLGNEQKWS